MKTLNAVALAVLIIGGLNWLLVGVFKYDLVSDLFGGQEDVVSRIIYIIVGVSALYALKFFSDVSGSRGR
ncbi:DUF378 domain-containing protein [Cohnella sp. 56]|uniref:DUF378 domain-containing protein n=1 Tax=Cohnella sp. 56 TaxID=3113722 RepID=UPI0030EA3F5D